MRPAGPSDRRRLGMLFTVLATLFAAIAVAAAGAGVWVVALAAAALAIWLGSMALGAFRAR